MHSDTVERMDAYERNPTIAVMARPNHCLEKKLVRKSALIVKFGQIGDVVMSIPAVRSLYDQGFESDWVCGKVVQPLLECYSWIHLIPTDQRALLAGGVLGRAMNIAGLWHRIAFK